jgi:hypothetical protein
MTLLEVLFGMAVLTMTSFSILSGIVQSYRLAQLNLYDETALVMAQSYLEDIKGLTYAQMISGNLPVHDGGMTAGSINVRSLDVRSTPGSTSDDLHLDITPTVTLTSVANGDVTRPVNAYEIRLDYTWRFEGAATSTARSRTLRVIRSQNNSY